jgi:type VI protein secretion system component VasK
MLSSACCSTSAVSCGTSVISWRTMEKKRKRRSPNAEELDRRFEETSRLLEQRIAYHRALIARDNARRELPWYRRIFAA